MNENPLAGDVRALDGQLLGLLVAVVEEGGVGRAALRLGVTSSAVSHLLDRLRAIVGDPLFVRSGRGVVPTARALALLPLARRLLQDLHDFAQAEAFDPARLRGELTVAAGDLQRDLLLPAVLARLRAQAPQLLLRVIPSDVPTPEMLRDGRCRLVISPRPPDAADLLHRRLFTDRYRVYFDATQRPAPASLDDYLGAEHVSVVYEPLRRLALDIDLAERGVQRRIIVTVPGFAGVAAFVRGSRLLATAPALLADGQLRGLAHVAPPLPCPALPMYAIWHLRHQADPQQRWLLQAVLAAAQLAAPASAEAPSDG